LAGQCRPPAAPADRDLDAVTERVGHTQAEAVARREAQEEARCEILDLLPIYHYLASPGGTSESVRLFCGRVDSRGLGGVYGLAEEHEDIRVEVVPFAEARARLEGGRIGNAPTIIALQWLLLSRDSLRQRWSGG
jgi:ADP-ribose pyrophosphatase